MEIKSVFELASEKDIPDISEVYSQARQFMKKAGNPEQWGDNYPEEEFLRQNINCGNLYALKLGAEIAAVFTICKGKQYYDDVKIWQGTGEYLAAGNLAVADFCRGKGVGRQVLSFVCSRASMLNFNAVRMDTHTQNIPMQKLLSSQGFFCRGEIVTPFGNRLAYEKIL